MMNKETMVVNAIRILSAEAVQKAKSGTRACPWALRRWHMPYGDAK